MNCIESTALFQNCFKYCFRHRTTETCQVRSAGKDICSFSKTTVCTKWMKIIIVCWLLLVDKLFKDCEKGVFEGWEKKSCWKTAWFIWSLIVVVTFCCLFSWTLLGISCLACVPVSLILMVFFTCVLFGCSDVGCRRLKAALRWGVTAEGKGRLNVFSPHPSELLQRFCRSVHTLRSRSVWL